MVGRVLALLLPLSVFFSSAVFLHLHMSGPASLTVAARNITMVTIQLTSPSAIRLGLKTLKKVTYSASTIQTDPCGNQS
ncbi:hypothetical protein [Paenibacillus medicaginis]|uniref:Uncharacterized protein n=1 Tax=Paenibacillus medicaginis TaxID=1470560 RepID=A0ABV5C5M8_9BACL